MSNIDNNDYITVGAPLTIVDLRSAVAEYQDDRKALEEELDKINHEAIEAEANWHSGDDTEANYDEAVEKLNDANEKLQALVEGNNALDDLLFDAENYRADTLIPKEDFEDYILEIALVDANLPAYVENNIDWSGVADDLRQDYAESHGYLFLAG